MGQHKTNPNVKLAKEGLLPKTPKKKSKQCYEREVFDIAFEKLFGWLPFRRRYD